MNKFTLKPNPRSCLMELGRYKLEINVLKPANCTLKATLELKWRSSPLLNSVAGDSPHLLQILLSAMDIPRRQETTLKNYRTIRKVSLT